MAFSITSANAVLMLRIPTVYDIAQQIQEFGVDDAFTTDAVDASETQVGVDGFGVAGYIPRSPRMRVRLLASSRSLQVFEDWITALDALQDVIYADALITLTSVGKKYTCNRGSLMGVSTHADARRVLQNREFGIQWLPTGTLPAITSAPA